MVNWSSIIGSLQLVSNCSGPWNIDESSVKQYYVQQQQQQNAHKTCMTCWLVEESVSQRHNTITIAYTTKGLFCNTQQQKSCTIIRSCIGLSIKRKQSPEEHLHTQTSHDDTASPQHIN